MRSEIKIKFSRARVKLISQTHIAAISRQLARRVALVVVDAAAAVAGIVQIYRLQTKKGNRAFKAGERNKRLDIVSLDIARFIMRLQAESEYKRSAWSFLTKGTCTLLTHSSQKGRALAPQCSTGSSESSAVVLHKFPRLRPEHVYDSLNASYASRARGVLSSRGNPLCVGGESN